MATTFEQYYEKFMEMTKAEIIREGQVWGIWAPYQSTTTYLMKNWTKNMLVRGLADKLVRLEARGY